MIISDLRANITHPTPLSIHSFYSRIFAVVSYFPLSISYFDRPGLRYSPLFGPLSAACIKTKCHRRFARTSSHITNNLSLNCQIRHSHLCIFAAVKKKKYQPNHKNEKSKKKVKILDTEIIHANHSHIVSDVQFIQLCVKNATENANS